MGGMEKVKDACECLVKEIENRFTLIIGISMFFPALVLTFFRFVKQSDDMSNAVFLTWAGLIGFYLLAYVFFQVLKNKMGEGWLRWLDILSLIEIGLFVFPVAVFASTKQNALSFLTGLSFQTALYALQLVPLITLLLIFVKGGIESIKFLIATKNQSR
jgi:hypothetical protein